MTVLYSEPIPAGCYMTLALDDDHVIARGVAYPGIPAVGTLLVYIPDTDGYEDVCWEVLAVQVVPAVPGSRSAREGAPLLADVIVRPDRGVYARYPGAEKAEPDGG